MDRARAALRSKKVVRVEVRKERRRRTHIAGGEEYRHPPRAERHVAVADFPAGARIGVNNGTVGYKEHSRSETAPDDRLCGCVGRAQYRGGVLYAVEERRGVKQRIVESRIR